MSGVGNTTNTSQASRLDAGLLTTSEQRGANAASSQPAKQASSKRLSPEAARSAATQARERVLPEVKVIISGTGSVGNTVLAAIMNKDTTGIYMVGSSRSVDRAQKNGYIIVEVGKGEPGSKGNVRKVVPVNKPGEYSPGKISVVSELPGNVAEGAIVIHAGLHEQIARFLKQPGVAERLNEKNASHVVLQNTLDAADVVKAHAQEGATIVQIVMKAAASRKTGADGVEFTYCKAGVNSAFEAIGVPDHLKEQFTAWFDREANKYSATKLVFGGLEMKYNKVAANAATNPLTVIFRTGNYGGVIKRYESEPGFAKLMQAIAVEAYEVGIKRGAFAEKETTEEKAQAARIVTYQPLTLAWENLLHPSSTNTSFSGGDKTEIGGINGGIARLGKEYGVPTPVNSAITQCFVHIEKLRPEYKTVEDFYADPNVEGYLQGVQENLFALAEEAAEMDDMHKIIFNSYLTDMESLAQMNALAEANERDPKFVSKLTETRS